MYISQRIILKSESFVINDTLCEKKEYTQTEVRRESKHVSTKKNQQTQKKEARDERMTKTIRHTENNEQNGRSQFFTISNYFKCK